MHVAVAQKAKIVSLWGPSNEAGFGPYDQSSAVITATDVSCRPCSRHNCAHHSCMKNIKPETVLQAVIDRLELNGAQQRPAVFLDRDGVLKYR